MLARTFRLPTNLQSSYSDVQRSDWFWSYAGIAARYGLFTTPDPTRLYPNVLVHHFEVSQGIERVLASHPELRPTPSAVLERPVQADAPFVVGTASHGAAPDVGTSRQPQEYITVRMVKDALMQVLRSNVLVATQTKVDLLQQINTERARYGIPALALNPVLTTAAQGHAEDMWKRHYFDHITPEGRTYVDRIRRLGYLTPRNDECGCGLSCECLPAFALGENIAQGQFTVEQVMRDWMNSPAHRQNILSTEFRDIGFGLFGTVWVQTFGRIDFVPQYR